MMSSHRPFAEDQAEGLRRMFAASQRESTVVGFISAGRDCGAAAAIELVATQLRADGKQVLLVDEQAPNAARWRDPAVLYRPMGLGAPINDNHRQQYDLILVDAYPSRESQVHCADFLVLVATAPECDTATVTRLLRAIGRAPQRLGLMLVNQGEKLRMLSCRQSIEDLAQKTVSRTLNWIGDIPMNRAAGDTAIAAANAAQRLCQLQPKKELVDV